MMASCSAGIQDELNELTARPLNLFNTLRLAHETAFSSSVNDIEALNNYGGKDPAYQSAF